MERGEQIMKKQQTKMCCLAAAVMFGFVLSACGSTDDVAGDDWRTSGVVAGSGTITHDGQCIVSHARSGRGAGLQRDFLR